MQPARLTRAGEEKIPGLPAGEKGRSLSQSLTSDEAMFVSLRLACHMTVYFGKKALLNRGETGVNCGWLIASALSSPGITLEWWFTLLQSSAEFTPRALCRSNPPPPPPPFVSFRSTLIIPHIVLTTHEGGTRGRRLTDVGSGFPTLNWGLG